MEVGDRSLIGRWEKLPGSDCDRAYPDTIEFFEATYLGAKGSGQAFIVWDAGTWQADARGSVRISTASDELVRYEYSVSGDVLSFRDPAGCQFSYRRRRS
jgi:hypothetical protein